jgi:DNA-binding beta-propeller fold protein YncE
MMARLARRLPLWSWGIAGWALGCASKPPAGVYDLLVSPRTVTLARHDTLRLQTLVVNDVGDSLTGVAVRFHSGDASIVTVDPFGLIRSVGPLGHTTIDVTAAGILRTVDVTVVGVPGTADTFIFQRDQVQLVITVLDSGGIVIPGASVALAASGPISIDQAALVTSLGPAGEGRVSATYNGYLKFSNVHVLDTALAGRVTAAGHPDAVGMSRTGTALISRDVSVLMVRLDLPAVSITSQIVVPWGLSAIVFDTTGTRAYALDPVGKVHVIDLATNTDIDSFPTAGVPTALAVSRDNQSLFVATSVDSLFRYDRTTAARSGASGLPWHVSAIGPHPTDAALLYLAIPDSGLVLEYDVAGDSIRRRLSLGGRPVRIALAPDGTALYAGDTQANALAVWDLAADTSIAAIPLGAAPADLGLDASGSRIWVSLRTVGRVTAIDRVSRSIVRTVSVGGAPRGLGVSPVDGRVVAANDSGWVDVIKP